MIVAGPEGFVKGQYRKFNIKSARARARRRLRHDARGADAAFQAVGRYPSPLWGGGIPEGAAEGNSTGAVTESPPPGLPHERGGEVQPPAQTSREMKKLALGMVPLRASERVASDLPPESDSELDEETGEDSAANDEPAFQEAFPDRPDLVLRSTAASGSSASRATCCANWALPTFPLIGVAKGPERDAGREHFHMPGNARPIMLEPRDPVLYFVQRLRDEAHRFAIGTHRAKRSKAIGANPLDEIDGIGPKRKRALLKHFGSAKAVSRAGIEDLKAVEGISAEMAQKIYDFFHERRP